MKQDDSNCYPLDSARLLISEITELPFVKESSFSLRNEHLDDKSAYAEYEPADAEEKPAVDAIIGSLAQRK